MRNYQAQISLVPKPMMTESGSDSQECGFSSIFSANCDASISAIMEGWWSILARMDRDAMNSKLLVKIHIRMETLPSLTQLGLAGG